MRTVGFRRAGLVRCAAAALLAGACALPSHSVRPQAKPYLFYLHGRIVEDQGPRAVSPRFGPYDYRGIVAAFRARGLKVISEVRPSDTDPSRYADRIVEDVRRLIASGVEPSRITIVGASKGAVIAALVSARLGEPGARYVLLANCNDTLISTYDPRLTGEVLSVFEASDDIGRSCEPLFRRSPGLARSAEIRLDTGLGHGIVYQPLEGWVGPAADWALRP